MLPNFVPLKPTAVLNRMPGSLSPNSEPEPVPRLPHPGRPTQSAGNSVVYKSASHINIQTATEGSLGMIRELSLAKVVSQMGNESTWQASSYAWQQQFPQSQTTHNTRWPAQLTGSKSSASCPTGWASTATSDWVLLQARAGYTPTGGVIPGHTGMIPEGAFPNCLKK